MNQLEGIRYKKRIVAASLLTLITTSAIGMSSYVKSSAVSATNSVVPNLDSSNGLVEALASAGVVVLPFALLVSYVLYTVLSFKYTRDPGYQLIEGCYSDTSWLNLRDKQLVVLDKDTILTAEFDDNQADQISETYQNDSSCKGLLYVLSSQQIRRISIANIESLISDKNEHFIEITSRDESLVVQFANTSTKAHALEYIVDRLPTTLTTTVDQTSSLKLALPQLMVGGLFALAGLLSNQASLAIVLAMPAVFLLPGIIESVFDPVHRSEWHIGEAKTNERQAYYTSSNRHAA